MLLSSAYYPMEANTLSIVTIGVVMQIDYSHSHVMKIYLYRVTLFSDPMTSHCRYGISRCTSEPVSARRLQINLNCSSYRLVKAKICNQVSGVISLVCYQTIHNSFSYADRGNFGGFQKKGVLSHYLLAFVQFFKANFPKKVVPTPRTNAGSATNLKFIKQCPNPLYVKYLCFVFYLSSVFYLNFGSDNIFSQ